ncbi:MAG: DUF2905 domain-containing protein [Armatimonadetes bacterium]|nr:DUF2905 domain-containing protein [Armatimonadota bacterium]
MNLLGRMLIGVGLLIALAGLFMVGVSRLAGGQGWRLPGDVLIRRDHVTVYIPIATSILISVLLTVLLYLVSLFSRR